MEIKKLNKLSYEILKETYKKLKQINNSHILTSLSL